MSDSQEIIKESASVIQEIESQLERLLSAKKEDVNNKLSGMIQKEKDAARKDIEGIEREFEREKEALYDYRIMVAEVEAERDAVLNEIREHLKRALHYQVEIENLAKLTIDESKKVNDLQHKLESLRQKTAEKASFLKKDLREKFGIIAEISSREKLAMPTPDLDQELEKLKKIKGLLTGEVLNGEEKQNPSTESTERESPGRNTDDGRDSEPLGIRDLLESTLSADERKDEGDQSEQIPSMPMIAPESKDKPPSTAADALGRMRKTEPANGSGEISYYQRGDKFILDIERLLTDIGRTLDEARRLALKLELTESPKDLFFIKQELINNQEGLRRLMLRAVKKCENKIPALPRQTTDVLDVQTLKDILDKLSLGNWANPDEFDSFDKYFTALREAFQERSLPPDGLSLSILDDLEVE